METTEQIVKGVQNLADRFLSERYLDKDVETGMADLDTDVGAEGDVYDEVQSFMQIAQQSSMNAYMAITQLLKPTHQEKLVTLFGEKAEELLKQTKACLEGISGLFSVEEEPEEDEESEEESEEEPEESEEE